MRTTHLVDSLFPKIRQGILAATLTHPDKWWYLRELSRHLTVTPSSLQRELNSLVSVGILNRKREGKHVYFKADTESPIFSELRGLILKTAGLVDVIRRCLKPFEKEIKIAFIYGSVARAEERSLSDIDLLLIGKVLLSDISPSFRKIEEIVGREVNGSVLSPLEFHGKLKRKNNFVMNIMKSKKIFISGDENDLAKMAG